jgi:glycerol-3-phosphate dehydrogenase
MIPAVLAGALFALPAVAVESHIELMTRFAQETARAWTNDPEIIAAIKAQNARHASISQSEIDQLDKQWREQTKASERPLIDQVLSTTLSKKLAETKNQARGMITELFVMDNKGLNVGQSDATSDYWQGDEDKWQKTYLAGPGAMFIDEIEMDESTQTFQSQLSLSIADPATGQVIGAVTVGVDVDQLLQ